ncbi:MAG: hypothetical protein WCT07_02260 [Candidatus Paceibacterota bacterium]|jgi:hypothetical protein
MESSPLFNAPKPTTDEKEFTPLKNLPEHLMEYQKVAKETRDKMTPVMSAILQLTDKMALRGAATILNRGEAANDEDYRLAA